MQKNFLLKLIFLIVLLFAANTYVMAQKSKFQKFLDLRYPEKIWVIFHPFVAGKVHKISVHARDLSIEKARDPELDGDHNGGQVDAFRHGYWMMLVTQEVGAFSARWLGRAHEKTNELDFKHKVLEDGSLPCFKACEMDLKNNDVGIIFAKKHPNCGREEAADLIKQKVLEGKFFVIKKNAAGEFLNSLGKVIPEEEHLGLWHTPKTLVPSNFMRPPAE